jgi:mediator of RNA polymerase II transcription subunit 6
MAMKIPPLDEQDWNVPQALNDLPEQNIDKANNFMWYFHSSQFMEPACNNTAILNTHVNDPATYDKIHNRKQMDEALHSIPEGLRFIIAGEPQAEGQPWLYQRQNMIRNQENKVETFVEGNWYNRGTQILMAPSLLDVVRARLVSNSWQRSYRTRGGS